MTKFKLNTATRTWGRVKGWNSTSDLEETVKSVMRMSPAYNAVARVELASAIRAEIAKAEPKLEQERIRIRHATRDTRSGRATAQRFDRAYYKLNALQDALKVIEPQPEHKTEGPESEQEK